MTGGAGGPRRRLPFAALLIGNVALALGPWFVRLADSGPIAAGFWRLALALPLLALLAGRERQSLAGIGRWGWAAMAGAGILFALDLASWHVGIETTRLANATLFGNSGSIVLMAWGLAAAGRLPSRWEGLAIASALAGAAILLGRSLDIDARTLTGDLLCILAGLFYAFYILLLQGVRHRLGNWSLLLFASVAGAPLMLVFAVLNDEPVWPGTWWPLIALTLGSQIIGQGLLVYALKHFTSFVIGLVLLTQPAVAIVVGWPAFGEAIGPLDAIGMALVAGALVLAKWGDAPASPGSRAAVG